MSVLTREKKLDLLEPKRKIIRNLKGLKGELAFVKHKVDILIQLYPENELLKSKLQEIQGLL